MTKSHTVSLSGLQPGSTYSFEASSGDRSGLVGRSEALTFTTSGTQKLTTELTTEPTTEPRTELCDSVSQHGATFTFDTSYP